MLSVPIILLNKQRGGVKADDGMLAGFGEIVKAIVSFAKGCEMHLFNIDFTLWDVFIAGLLISLLYSLWCGLTE